VDRVFGWLAEYSYACVLIAAAIDAMALPFPGRLVLLSAGILAAAGRVDLLGTIAAGLLGAVVGDHLWYFGGRLARGRLHALHRWLARRRVRLATDPVAYLRRYGGLVILIGRFIATVRVLVWPIASAHGIGYGRFLAWDLGAAALWAGVFVLGGCAFGGPALTMMKGLGGPAFIAAGVGISVVGGGMLTGLPSLRGREKGLSKGIPRYGSARDLRSWRLWAIGFLGAEATEG
jgi:membrane protein DedA with SNARE-associated domain